jgi:tRNA pseudouridine55 synthase
MRNGVVLIDKVANMSSAAVVARVKRHLKADKVGHAGTLDPDATGLLICLVNGATRVASYALDGMKVYSGTMRLGVRTSTDDMTGDVIEESTILPSFEAASRAARYFVGTIEQVPPKVSAIKVGGRRAYQLERAGHDVQLKGRQVVVEQFDVTEISDRTIGYRIVCSPGTYVRALARDLGEKLGCGAAAETIRREGSGHFSVSDAVALEDLSWDRVQDWSILVPHVPRIVVSSQLAIDLLQGRMAALSSVGPLVAPLSEGVEIVAYAAEGREGETLGLLRLDGARNVGFELNVARQPQGSGVAA